jgi:hypothetical protein
MPSFSASAAEPEAGPSAFETLTQAVDLVMNRIKREIANRQVLESIAETTDADDIIIPGELVLYIEYQGYHFRAPATLLNVDNFTKLIEPLRRANAEALILLVDELADAVQNLYEYCHPLEKGAPDDGQQSADGTAPNQPAGGLLAAIQQRAAKGL